MFSCSWTLLLINYIACRDSIAVQKESGGGKQNKYYSVMSVHMQITFFRFLPPCELHIINYPCAHGWFCALLSSFCKIWVMLFNEQGFRDVGCANSQWFGAVLFHTEKRKILNWFSLNSAELPLPFFFFFFLRGGVLASLFVWEYVITMLHWQTLRI